MIRYKQLLLFAMTILFTTASQAQSSSEIVRKIQPGINAEAAFPVGDFGKSYSFGIGGSVMGRYALSDKADLTASLGYISFSGKDITVSEVETDDGGNPIHDDFGNPMYTTTTMKAHSYHGVPLRLGANYLVGGPLFIQGEIGAAFLKGGTAFLYTPGIGVRFNQFEAEAKYEGWSKNGTLSFFGLRVGYFF
ncbi:MAG: hypothetical protein M9898_08930 [Chitinophagaceae bacterium]|nr:hypothetical protein [Chitinophagaceae bacterium]